MKIRNLERLINNIVSGINKVNKMNIKYPQMYYYELNKIGGVVIDQWYKTYDPMFYHRKGSLYNSFSVTLNDGNYSVEFDNSLMKNYYDAGKSDYIFDLSFIEGYHGGAKNGKTRSGENHPHVGVPYWRTPFPEFTHWGRPAVRSWSPYHRMVSLMNKKIKEIDTEKQYEFNKIVNQIKKSINNL